MSNISWEFIACMQMYSINMWYRYQWCGNDSWLNAFFLYIILKFSILCVPATISIPHRNLKVCRFYSFFFVLFFHHFIFILILYFYFLLFAIVFILFSNAYRICRCSQMPIWDVNVILMFYACWKKKTIQKVENSTENEIRNSIS